MLKPLLSEGVGSAILLYVVVGSGMAAETISTDPGVQLLAHAVTVGLGLAVAIALFQTVSGSHFNPSVTLGFLRTGAITGGDAWRYGTAQVAGAVTGVVCANLSFETRIASLSTTPRGGPGPILSEAVATFVLVLLILALVRTGRDAWVPAAVGGWVAAAILATSSTGFANPAVTVARMFTDSYTGIAPASVFPFVAAQLGAGLAAASSARFLYSDQVSMRAPT